MTSSSVKAERRPWWLLLTWGLWMIPAGIALAENSLPEVRTYPASRIGPDTATLQFRVKQFEYLDGPRPRRTGDREFRGGVRQGRFGCREVTSEPGLLVVGIYVDLNERRSGLAATLEESLHSLLGCRLSGRSTVTDWLVPLTLEPGQFW